MNGKVYDYYGNKICEIKDGKGKIKEYHYNGNLKFEGEYLNGERNGNGKEYYNNGNLKFEGVYLKDKRWNGKYYNTNSIMGSKIKDGKFCDLLK